MVLIFNNWGFDMMSAHGVSFQRFVVLLEIKGILLVPMTVVYCHVVSHVQ